MEKRAHQYKLDLERIASPDLSDLPEDKLTLTFTNHDNLFEILEKIKARNLFDENTSTEFVIGLKLLGEVLIRNRDHPLFSEFKEAYGDFMKKLKSGGNQ